MNLSTLLIAAFIAVAYVAWPNLAKPLGVSPGLVALIVILVALGTILFMAPNEIVQIRTLSMKAAVIIIAFAVANGVAIYLQASKAADPQVVRGVFLVSIFLLQTAFAPFVDWFANGTVPTARQITGLVLAAPTMWLLVKA